MQMVTATGKIISLLGDFSPDIYDIAIHLANECRFVGALGGYSVAQHSVHVSLLVPRKYAFQALMHDAHEAYTKDLPKPHKEIVGEGWNEFETRVAEKVRRHFGVPPSLNPLVKEADRKAMNIELGNFARPEARPAWVKLGYSPDYSNPFDAWSAELAEQQFLKRFKQIGPGLPAANPDRRSGTFR